MFQLSINTANSAFDDDAGIEVGRIMRELADRLDDSPALPTRGNVRDINGNTVGSWTLDPDDES